jgi:hypothetical protein
MALPLMLTGFELSYSAANEWCAQTGTAAVNRAAQPAMSKNLDFMKVSPVFSG